VNKYVDVPPYDNAVANMQDITKLVTVEFNDKFEISPGPKPTINFWL